jgi:uncharacterized protein YllA (UPF0747 family)
VARARVVEVLGNYNDDIGNPHGSDLCRKLEDPRCLVVTSGHQPGLFGGPLMVFAKAAGTALAAISIAREWDGPVVPLFWNHSEDHDVDEIRTLTIMKQGSPARLKAPLPRQGRSFDSLEVDADLVAYAGRVLEEIPSGGDPDVLLPRRGERFPRWTSRILIHLLHETPLLHVEPHVVAPLLGDLFERCIGEVAALGAAARAGESAVNDAGCEAQVQVTDDSQLFLRDDQGRRTRLRFDREWNLSTREGFEGSLGASLDDATLRRLARTRPELFSSNVLLRPVALQELFPVAAHLCGPGEIAYFAQLPELFAWAGRPVPAVIPRPTATLLGPEEEQARMELGLEGDWVLREPGTWPTQESRLEEAKSKAHRRLRHGLAQWIWPRGRPQERLLGPVALLPRRDPVILGKMMATLEPWDMRHQALTLEEGDAPHA